MSPIENKFPANPPSTDPFIISFQLFSFCLICVLMSTVYCISDQLS